MAAELLTRSWSAWTSRPSGAEPAPSSTRASTTSPNKLFVARPNAPAPAWPAPRATAPSRPAGNARLLATGAWVSALRARHRRGRPSRHGECREAPASTTSASERPSSGSTKGRSILSHTVTDACSAARRRTPLALPPDRNGRSPSRQGRQGAGDHRRRARRSPQDQVLTSNAKSRLAYPARRSSPRTAGARPADHHPGHRRRADDTGGAGRTPARGAAQEDPLQRSTAPS